MKVKLEKNGLVKITKSKELVEILKKDGWVINEPKEVKIESKKKESK